MLLVSKIMGLTWRDVLKLIIGSVWIGIAAAFPIDYTAVDIITRDVCVIGGGSSGTYSAIRLHDLGKSVVLVERKDRLGGHTYTYTDPATQEKTETGVLIFHNLSIVRNYFTRFDIPLTAFPLGDSAAVSDYVDLRTGKVVSNYTPSDPTAALAAYAVQAAKYPYLEEGFYLPDPVPGDLLLSFGDFVTKYSLQALVNFVYEYAQGLGDLLRQPTLYVLKNFSLAVLQSLQVGFVTTARHDNSELYEKALAVLGDDVLLNSCVVATQRNNATRYVEVLVETPSGLKLIRAKKIVLTIPPKLYNLVGWDLDATERSLFGQFGNSAYYTGLLRNVGIPDNIRVSNRAPNTPYNLPVLPCIYDIGLTIVPGLRSVFYVSAVDLSDEKVKADIVASVLRLQTAGTLQTTTPDFAIFENHNPFELTVPTSAIEAGFYRELYALQGRHRTYYTGAAFHAHDSSLLWRFTEALLPSIAA